MLICSSYEEERQVSPAGNGGRVPLYEERCSPSSDPQGSPPPYSRLPPDGHEFPASYSEDLQDKITLITQYAVHREINFEGTNNTAGTINGGSPSTLPRLPPKVSSPSSSLENRSLSRWRRQDERSERSVRDKIAMFSSEKQNSKSKTRKIDKFEFVNSGVRNEKSFMKRSLTEDDVRIESICNDNKLCSDSSPETSDRRPTKPSVYSSMINVHTSDSDSKENVKPASSETDVRLKNSKTNKDYITNQKTKSKIKLNESKDDQLSGLNNRSQSLIDIGKSTRMKRHSVGAYDRPSAYKYGVEKPEERERRTSLNNLIEQRRKSMSKLRGLVIPETRTGEVNEQRFPIDLPRISSHTSQNIKTMSLPRNDSKSSRLYKTDSISSIDSCSSSASRSSCTPSHTVKALIKLSPANNRKNSLGTPKHDSLPPLSSRTTRNQSPLSDFSGSSSTPRTVSPQRSLDRALTPNFDASFEMDNKISTERTNSSKSHYSLKSSSLDSRFTRGEESDNDSAVSSTQSSFSQCLSPRASPMPDHYDHDDRHSPTRSSRPHHSPQSSFDELDPKRVLKSGSIEAENRRNILKSAKCSSGRNSDEQSTPEIVRKFSKESTPELHCFNDRLDSDLREGPQKTGLRREGSTDSSSSISSQHSSLSSSRRNSRDSVIHVNHNQSDAKVSAQPVYFDGEGDMYKDSQVKVAFLNEIVNDFEEVSEKENVVAEIPLSNKSWGTEAVTNTMGALNTREGNKWSALEQKYSTGKISEYGNIDNKISRLVSQSDDCGLERHRSSITTKKTNFQVLANKWKQRTEEDPNPRQPQAQARKNSISLPDKSFKREESVDSGIPNDSRTQSRTEKCFDESSFNSSQNSPRLFGSREERPNSLNISRSVIHDRKFSVPEYSTGLKLREKRDGNIGDISSRPTSLIEGSNAMETLRQDGQYMTPLSPSSTSTGSRDDLLDSSEASLSRTGSKEVLDAFSKPCPNLGNSVIPKMSEIMRAFERHDMNSKGVLNMNSGCHPRMSSLDSTASDDGSQGAHYGSVSSLASGQRDQYGSITSLSSSTSIISPQELAQLIEEANHSLEESGTPSHEILVVVLHREIVGHGSIGITLAGGADYETKEITVHKVIPGSLADRDGRIQKGDRVLSINGKTLRGVSHREALNILKSPRPEVVLVLSRSRSVTPQESTMTQSIGDIEGGFSHRPVFINHVPPPRPPKILESPMDSKSLVSDFPCETIPRGPPMTITLIKDGAGLGFSLEGGKDSPLGDRPLTIKKVFSGGAADKGGVLVVGDELLGVNSVDLTNMARIEAWNFLKKLPDGKVSLVIRQKLKGEKALSHNSKE